MAPITQRLRLFRRTPAFNWDFTEQHGADRLPICLAVRLRVGTTLYEGRA